MNIAIVSTVQNKGLFTKTSMLLPRNISHYVIDGSNGMHGISLILYVFKKLKIKNYDYLIFLDEDVVITNFSSIYDLILRMSETKTAVVGVRDGGVIRHRNYNPIPVNTFFMILDFKDIISVFNANEILSNQYIKDNEFNANLGDLIYDYNSQSLYEPYYCFFLWLKRSGRTFLYIDVKECFDELTTGLIFEKNLFAYHTWHARSYGKNEYHTNRINNVLKEFKTLLNGEFVNENIIYLKDSFFWLTQFLKKSLRRFRNRFFLSSKVEVKLNKQR